MYFRLGWKRNRLFLVSAAGARNTVGKCMNNTDEAKVGNASRLEVCRKQAFMRPERIPTTCAYPAVGLDCRMLER